MSATEAWRPSLSLSSSWSSASTSTIDFEFDFDFDFLGTSFRGRVSGTCSGVRFWSLFGSIWGSIFGPFRDPRKDPKRNTLGNGVIPTIAWGIARENAGLRTSRHNSPISLTLPLSSFGWLRNNSSSHRCSASVRNFRPHGFPFY